MSKLKKVQIIGFILFTMYIGAIILDVALDIFGDYRLIIFSVLLAIISLNLIYKGVLIKSASTMWFANTLMMFAITIIVFEIIGRDVMQYYYVFSFVPIISSLVNLAIFNNFIYIKVIIINISIIVPICVTYFVSLSIWWQIVLWTMSIIIGIIICRMMNVNKEKA